MFIKNAMSGNYSLESLRGDYAGALADKQMPERVAKLRALQDELISWEELEEIVGFRNKLEASHSDQYCDENGVLEDVYQAALYLLTNSAWRDNTIKQYRFRGQCSVEWELEPSICRSHNPRVISMLRDDLEAFIHEVLKDNPHYTKEQAEAIGQHYGVKSHYIDVSTCPLVALFLSTHQRTCREKIGVVQILSKPEWERMFKRDIREVHLDEVAHIRNQQGSFITGSHPNLFEQYVACEIRFHHRDNLAFEDPARGIVTNFIYPPIDEHEDLVNVWKKRAWETAATFPPRPILENTPYDPIVLLTAEDYFVWIQQLYEDYDNELGWKTRDGAWKPSLMKLCRFHTALQHPAIKMEISRHMRSLNRLSSAVSALLCDPTKDATDAWDRGVVEGYLSHARGNAVPTRHMLEIFAVMDEGHAMDG